MRRATLSELAIVLAPLGRDGEIAGRLLREIGIASRSADSLSALVSALDGGAAFAVMADEALDHADLSRLARWIDEQEPWSDLPFILLTRQGGGQERNPRMLGHLRLLGNVAVLERPFHPASFASHAQAALRQRRRQYQARATSELAQSRLAEIEGIYGQAHVGLCVLDRDLRFVRINERLAEMNGLPAAAHLGRTVGEIVPELESAARAIAERVFATGEAVNDVEIVGETPAQPGVVRVWVEQWLPHKDARGAVVGVNISVEEVTAQRRAAERQRALLALTEGLLHPEADERAIAERLHREIGPLVGADLLFNYLVADASGGLSLVHGAGVPDALLARALTIEPGSSLCDAVAASGRRLVLDDAGLAADPRAALVRAAQGKAYACHPIAARDGQVLGTLSFGSTRRVKFEQEDVDFLQTVANYVAQAWDRLVMMRALRRAERQTRLVLDGALAFIGLLTPDGVLLEANKAALEAGGLAREDVVGRPFWDCFWWSYDEAVAARLKAAVAEARQGRSVRYDAVVRMAGDRRMSIDFMLAPLFDEGGKVAFLVPSGFDITERIHAQARQQLLANELAHRGKNLLAVVQTIVTRSLATASDLASAKEAASGRIQALARTYDAIRAGHGEAADLGEVVAAELAALPRQATTEGTPIVLSPRAAQTFGLIVHELGTNAVKHGALSTPSGRVEIGWRLVDGGGERRLRFQWRERGGPTPAPPSRKGFGMTLLTSVAAADFRCQPELEYGGEGLSYSLDADLDALAPDPKA